MSRRYRLCNPVFNHRDVTVYRYPISTERSLMTNKVTLIKTFPDNPEVDDRHILHIYIYTKYIGVLYIRVYYAFIFQRTSAYIFRG